MYDLVREASLSKVANLRDSSSTEKHPLSLRNILTIEMASSSLYQRSQILGTFDWKRLE